MTDTEGKITAEKWFAQEVGIHHSADNKMILIYQYWVKESIKDNTYNKLGIVTATSEDGKIFEGSFKDFLLATGEIIREGKVKINKVDP